MPSADVSVIVPYHDAEATVGRCLRSVALQTVQVREILLVDDASPVPFVVPRDLDRSTASRLRVVRHAENLGAAAARNTAVGMAEGAWLAFLDADDAWLRRKVEVQHGLMASRGWHLSGHGYAPTEHSLVSERSTRAVSRAEFIVTNPFHTPTVMVRREGFRPFDARFRRADDYKAWVENHVVGRTFRIGAVLAHGHKPAIGHSGLSGSLPRMHESYLEVLDALRREGTISRSFHLAARAVEGVKYPLRRLKVRARVDAPGAA